MRKLATIRKINDIAAIEGADRIVAYQVDGWWVVDQKDKYNIGDEVVYFEIDSWVPHKLAPFLSKGAMPKTFNGVEGNRLRTIRLKGQLSQGLIISIQQCLEFLGVNEFPAPSEPQPEGEYVDLTDVLGVLKWEAPVHASLGGLVRGNFPSWGRKTDQERIQNPEKRFSKSGTMTKICLKSQSNLTVHLCQLVILQKASLLYVRAILCLTLSKKEMFLLTL